MRTETFLLQPQGKETEAETKEGALHSMVVTLVITWNSRRQGTLGHSRASALSCGVDQWPEVLHCIMGLIKSL